MEVYNNGLKQLDLFNPEFILMVCNTIHLYHYELQMQIKAELLDLRKEVEHELKQKKITKAMILGTPCTISLGLYEFAGIDYFNPSKEDLVILSNAVFAFNKGEEKQKQKQKVLAIVHKYLSHGAEVVILGCTEFALMLSDEDLPILNTMDVLVNAVLRKYAKRNGLK